MYRKAQPYIFEFFTRAGYLLFLMLAVVVPRVCLAAAAPKPDAPQRKVSERAIEAVVLAVKDEVYSHGYHNAYSDVGPDKIRIYIDPYVRNNLIWTIYKLMPHGEVFRAAYVRKDGLAVLIGDPFNGFPPTNRAATKTLYMDDGSAGVSGRSG